MTDEKYKPTDLWLPVSVVAINRGDHATYEDLMAVVADFDVAFLSEMMSEDRSRKKFRQSKQFGIWEGDLEDSAANCVVWNKNKIHVGENDKFCKRLLPEATRDGKHNMAKSLNWIRGQVEMADRDILFGVFHQIQTVYTKHRTPAAKAFNRRMVDLMDGRERAVILGGDGNAEWDNEVTRALRKAGWKHTDAANTFPADNPKREIDWITWDDNPDPNVLRLKKTVTRKVKGTDHLARGAYFDVRVKA